MRLIFAADSLIFSVFLVFFEGEADPQHMRLIFEADSLIFPFFFEFFAGEADPQNIRLIFVGRFLKISPLSCIFLQVRPTRSTCASFLLAESFRFPPP
jgi:hypothetical protein